MDSVVIITLNYNKSDFTIQCIKSILTSEYDNFKIILVDNGSEKAEYNKLSTINDSRVIIKHIKKNCGYVGGVNYGLKTAKELNPGYYLIMNNDTIIDKHAIKELVSTAREYENNCIVSGKVYNMDEPDTLQYIGQWCRNFNKLEFPSYVQKSKEKDIGQYDKEMEMEMLDDMFWLLPDVVFKKVGYYSYYFYLYGEQNDYALRAKKNGVQLIYTPQAKIWHYNHLTTADGNEGFQKIYYWQGYALLLLAYLHLSTNHFFLLYLSKLIRVTIKSIANIVLLKHSKFKRNYLPYLWAHFYFTIWIFNKKPNKGFNPYIVYTG